ncbi:MAG: glycine cleavage system protein GcvH [Planctomycetota bacterium]
MDRPADARFAESHEWVIIDGDTATLGVSDFAIEHLGDLVFVDLPEAGGELEKGGTVCEIESVKAVGEVYSPVSGTITEVNSGLADETAPLSSDPFGAGWLVKIKLNDASEAEALMDVTAYEAYLETADPGP